MNRNYTAWYALKSQLEAGDFKGNFSEREIWWCSIGANIGHEEDGKHRYFERPVIVLRKYNKNYFLGLPLTSVVKQSIFYASIHVNNSPGSVLLSQSRTLSVKRLRRRLGKVSHTEFTGIKSAFKKLHSL